MAVFFPGTVYLIRLSGSLDQGLRVALAAYRQEHGQALGIRVLDYAALIQPTGLILKSKSGGSRLYGRDEAGEAPNTRPGWMRMRSAGGRK